MPRVHPGAGPSAAAGLATEVTLALVRDYVQSPNGRAGESYGAGPLTNAYSTILLSANAADANAAAVPDRCVLDALDMAFDTLGGGAASVICYLSEDAAGLYPLAHPITVPLVVSATAARYVVSYLVERAYRRSAAAGAAGTVYLQIRLDAGTANVVARLRWLP